MIHDYAFIIGDGHVKNNGSIYITHSIEQIEYALYKQNILTRAGYKTTAYRRSARDFHDRNTNKLYRSKESITIYTSATFRGKELRRMFYKNRKIIPSDIKLTPEDWAIIFMDDGNKNIISHQNNTINGIRLRVNIAPIINKFRIYTQSFNEAENIILQQSLRDYNIESSLETTKGGFGKYIIIRTKTAKLNFIDLIDEFVIPSMKYKLHI
jgi:hypothetical protein